MTDAEYGQSLTDETVVLEVKKRVGVMPHQCEGGLGCAFPDLEQVGREP